jgi:2-polyprenyl-6-methoxyphenol hydroxylase-like FAD-dependent oxidoreductase
MSTDSTTVVLIIGGGLGGLALAQLLLQSSSSIEVLIFERDENDNSRDQGYCIGLDPTGLDVLNKIRALDDLLADQSGGYYELSYFRLVNKYLHTLFNIPAKGIKLIDRNQLRRALLTNINVQWNKRFVSYTVSDNGVEAHFEDGTSVHGTILIACDGTKSLVRAQLIPEFQRNDLRIISVAGRLEQSDDLKKIQEITKDSLARIFGKQGHTLLILPFRQLWMWSLSWPEKESHEEMNISSNQLIDKARENFNDDEIIRLIERCSPSDLIGPYRLYSASCLKQNPFPNHPRITLLGDAAHPMTTHAGKGANTAFADAFDLANLLLNPSSSTLSEYEQKMFKRGYAAVKMSLTSTQMIHATGWRGLLRDGILSIIGYTMTLINFISMPFRWYKKKRD